MKKKLPELVFLMLCAAAALSAVAAQQIAYRKASGSSVYTVTGSSYPDGDIYDVAVINAASKEDFMEVKGIGEAKATDIIDYRDALEGYKSVYQLGEIPGISDEILDRIIEHFYGDDGGEPQPAETSTPETSPVPETEPPASETAEPKTEPPATTASLPKTSAEQTTTSETDPTEVIDEPKVRRKVNVNTADADEIADALLIDYSVAEEIIELRERIHGFSTVQELTLCDGFTVAMYSELKGYILLE